MYGYIFFFFFLPYLAQEGWGKKKKKKKGYEESNFSHFSRYRFQEFANRVSILRRKCLLETKAHRA